MRKRSRIRYCIVGILGILLHTARGTSGAELKLPSVFSDGMVLQRDIPAPVWGQAEPGETVTVRFGDQVKTVKADPDGRWLVCLDPLPADSQPKTLTLSGAAATRVIQNVVVGEVWLCSGQSNMAFPVQSALEAPALKATATNSLIRYYGIPRSTALQPQEYVGGRWKVCTTGTVAGCSAAAYCFAAEIFPELGVPVGLLVNSYGGTPIEGWIPPEAFQADPSLADPASAGSTNPVHQPGAIYNAMIHPVKPYAFRGVLWYQGEANGAEGLAYLPRMKALITGWRNAWAAGNPLPPEKRDFPFYYVQLAGYQSPNTNDPAGGDGWAALREAQTRALGVTNTGMACAIDIGQTNNIHPPNKQDVGKRLALWALVKTYGRTGVCSGPLFKSLTVEDGRIRLSFDYTGGGLMVAEKIGLESPRETPAGRLKWFSIAGADKIWNWAEATIDGETVVVSSPSVPKPVAVRYAYTMHPEGVNLYNREGLPAVPFRTDEW